MYNDYYDYLDELLEEAYLEGYYDGYEDDYDDYYESNMSPGRRKKLRARRKAKTNHIVQRALDNVGFVQTGIDDFGNKIGYSQMGDGPKIPTEIISRKNKYYSWKYSSHPGSYLPNVPKMAQKTPRSMEYRPKRYNHDYYDDYDDGEGKIVLGIKTLKIPGSDIHSAHEYGHGYDFMKSKDKKTNIISNKLDRDIQNTAKRAGFKPKFSNEHDSRSSEMYADAFAVKNTKGQNNVNRMKKALNELNRREVQSSNDEYHHPYSFQLHDIHRARTEKQRRKQNKAWKEYKKNNKEEYDRKMREYKNKIKNQLDRINRESEQRVQVANKMSNAKFIKKVKR